MHADIEAAGVHPRVGSYLRLGAVDRAQVAQYHAVLCVGYRLLRGTRNGLPLAAAQSIGGACACRGRRVCVCVCVCASAVCCYYCLPFLTLRGRVGGIPTFP